MATKNLVPRATGEGQIGLSSKKWSQANFVSGSFDTLTVNGQSVSGGGSSTLAGLSDTDISAPSTAQILVHDGVDSFNNVSLSGDATIDSTGVLTIANTSITNDMLAGSIANTKLLNSSITLNSNSLSLGGSLTLDTGDIGEGSNLYYTDERVDDRVNSLLTAGTNISLSYDDNANTLTINSTASGADSISEGDSSIEVVDTVSDTYLEFKTDNASRWRITDAGHLVPQSDATYSIGSSSNQLNEIFIGKHKIHYEVNTNLYNDSEDDGALIIEGKILDPSSVQTDNLVLTLKAASPESGGVNLNQGYPELNLLSGSELTKGSFNAKIRLGSHVDSANGYFHSQIWDSKSNGNGNDWQNWYSGLNFSVNSTLPYKNISGVQDRDHVTFTVQTDKAIFWHPLELRYWDTSSPSHMKFYDSDNSNYTSLIQQSTVASNRTLTLPDETGTLATQTYVQNYVQGLDVKESVRVATTAGGTLSSSFENGDTIDDIALVTGDRILIKNQSTASENGIYVVAASGAPTRASDLAATAEAAGIFTFVEEGTTNGDKGFVCTSNSGSDVVGTDSLNFTTFSSAGSGLTDIVNDTSPQLGSSLDVNGQDIVSVSNGNITLTPNGTGVVRIDGTSGIDLQSGEISVKNSGSVSNIKLYCESANAHYTQLQSAAHSAYSGNVTLTLPTSTGTLVGSGDDGTVTNDMLAGSIADSKLNTITTADKVSLSALDLDGGTDIGADLVDADLIVVDDGAGGTNRKSTLSRIKKYVYSAISGDATATDAGVLTIEANAIEGSMLNNNTISGQTEMSGDLADTDELLISDAGTLKRADFSIVRDAIFNDVSGDASIAAGGSLTISSSAITSQTAETSIDDADLVLIYDDSASALRKMTKANFVSGLSGGGGGGFTYSAITSTTTAQASYHYSVDTSGGAVTLNLPARSGITAGTEIRVKLTAAGNDLTIDGNSTETIDGSETLVLNVANQSVTLVAGSATNWEII